MLNNIDYKFFLFFTGINLVYVILNTIKTILSVKGGKFTSSVSSAICYGFYIIILKAITGADYFTSIVGTIVSNIIGTYIGMWLTPLFIERPITSFKFTLDEWDMKQNGERLLTLLENYNISYNMVDAYSAYEKYVKFSAYSKTKAQDKALKNLLNELNIVNKHIETY